MNVSPSVQATGAAHGTHGKHGKGGDPLADFMALLDQLGISVDGDGKLSTAPTATAGAEDIAAKLLAKFGKKITDKPAADIAQLPPQSDGDQTEDGDPAAKLAEMLANLDQQPVDAGKGADIAGLLSAVRALVENKTKAAGDDNSVAQVSAKPAAGLAALLTRANPENSTAPTPTPGSMPSAFARLQKLVSNPAANDDAGTVAEGASQRDSALPDTASKNIGGADPAQSEANSAAKLTELLARLTASSKPGAAPAPSQPQLPQTATANAARPTVDPQIAALAQAIQQAAGHDRTKADADDQTGIAAPTAVGAASLGVINTPAATPTGVQTTAPADMPNEMMHHHLDLARNSEWLDTLARDIARAAQNDTHLRFNLNPEHLGSLKVELLNGANGTSVKLTADTEAARQILVDAQPRLIAEARAQGLRISEAQVNLSHQGSQGGQRQMGEAPVVIRTASAAAIAEVEQDMPAGSGERYA